MPPGYEIVQDSRPGNSRWVHERRIRIELDADEAEAVADALEVQNERDQAVVELREAARALREMDASEEGLVSTTTRTQDEIVARITRVQAEDIFGFRQEVLIGTLDFAHARPYLKLGVTEEMWEPEDPEPTAKGYLEFAIGKILDHRGISADRSVEKLREFAWLLGRDDVVAAMDAAPYPQYGAPQVKAFADGMGWPFVSDTGSDDELLHRMAAGDPCEPDCYEGCG